VTPSDRRRTSSPGCSPRPTTCCAIERDGAHRGRLDLQQPACAPSMRRRPDALVDLVLVDTAAWLGPPAEGSAAGRRRHQPRAAAGPARRAGGRSRRNRPCRACSSPTTRSRPPARTARAACTPTPPSRCTAAPLAPRDRRRPVRGRALGPRPHASPPPPTSSTPSKRSSRFWLKQPVFQVVSGATARPDGPRRRPPRLGLLSGSVPPARHPDQPRRLRRAASSAPTTYAAQLHQRKHGRWRSRPSSPVPRGRPPHPAETRLAGDGPVPPLRPATPPQ
jgi:hypothetical protein